MGPVTDAQLVAFAKSGKLGADDEVSSNGGASWTKAEKVRGLSMLTDQTRTETGSTAASSMPTIVLSTPSSRPALPPLPFNQPESPESRIAGAADDAVHQRINIALSDGATPWTLAYFNSLTIGLLLLFPLISITWYWIYRFFRVEKELYLIYGILIGGGVACAIAVGVCKLIGFPLSSTSIVGAERMTIKQLRNEILNGGKCVRYQYCMSFIAFTLKSHTAIYFIPAKGNATTKGLGISLASLLLGLWGVPWGPIYTIGALGTNFTGGMDVTPKVFERLAIGPP